MTDNIPERIRANAELVISLDAQQLAQTISYDEAGVLWLDGYIQRQHEEGAVANRDELTDTLGSFLGECIVQSFGGKWAEVDGPGCVRFDDRNAAYPFAKVAKHLEHGREESVLSFFRAVPALFQREPGSRSPKP